MRAEVEAEPLPARAESRPPTAWVTAVKKDFKSNTCVGMRASS
jgi:hypothetical protein